MPSNLENWINKLSFAEEKTYNNLTLLPIISNNGAGLKLLTLNKAVEDNLVEVREVAEGGTVPEITVIDKGKVYVLIVDGDHLIGAKQNRVVNKTIIIAPHSEVRIPVSCTEQGRWHSVSEKFSKSRFTAPSTVRGMFKEKKSAQDEVWDEVRERMQSFKVHSQTSSLEEVYRGLDSSIDEYKKAASLVPSQVGFMAFINGAFSGLDVLGDRDLFSELYDGLISGYIMDALYRAKDESGEIASDVNKKKVIRSLLNTRTRSTRSIGVEKRRVIWSRKVVGEFITLERKPVHFAVFPRSSRERFQSSQG